MMKNGDLFMFLIGPLVYSEVVDNLRMTTTLVIASCQEELEAYCDQKEQEDLSFMLTQARWDAEVMAVDAGQIQGTILTPEMGMSISTDFAEYIVRFKVGAVVTVCSSSFDKVEIERVLTNNGLPDVVDVLPAADVNKTSGTLIDGPSENEIG